MNKTSESVFKKLKQNSSYCGWLGLIFVSIVALFGNFPFGTEVNRYFWQRLLDAAHYPFFAIISFILEYQDKTRNCFRVAKRIIFLISIAIVVEFIQPFFGRSDSVIDTLNGFLGICIGNIIAINIKKGTSTSHTFTLVIVFLIGAVFVLVPAYDEYLSIKWRDRHIPIIAEFEDPVELRLWHTDGEKTKPLIELSDRYIISGNHSLHLSKLPSNNFGIIYDAGDKNWSRYKYLYFYVYSPDSLLLHIRIDDSGDCTEFWQRYNDLKMLEPGWNKIRISLFEVKNSPARKQLDLTQVRRFLLFTEPTEIAELFFDDFKLE